MTEDVIEGQVAKVELMPELSNEYTVGTWLITGPFHKLWDQWMVSCVHLRGNKDGEKAKLQFPGATHELIVVSVNTPNMGRQTANMTIEQVQHPKMFLKPIDIVQQFIARSDAHACSIVHHLLTQVANGKLSPDQDYRSVWHDLLTEVDWSGMGKQ